MTEIKALTLLEIRSLFGINKYLHSNDKKAKNRYRLLGIVWIILIGMVFFYVGGLVYALCSLGFHSIVLSYLVVIAALLIFAFGLFKAGSTIFGQKGYDILTSMPLKSGSVVISRFAAMYIEDLLLALMIMIPGVGVYGVCQHPDLWFYLKIVVGTLFVPAIPLVISVLFGTLVMAISSRMRYKSMAQTILMVIFVVGIMIGSFRIESFAEDITLEKISELAASVGELYGKFYPPALWFGNGQLILFLLVSIGSMMLAIYIVSKNFHSIMRRLLTFSAKHNYEIGTMESRSLRKTLYIREMKRYFSSSVYVTNTIVGPILGCILSVALCVVGIDMMIPKEISSVVDIKGLLPFVISAMFCVMPTTFVAISMEGKQFWVIQSLPITAKALFDSKILLSLSIMFPFYLVSEICLVIAVRPSPMELLWIISIPILLILFVVVSGITVNLKFHSFDWEKEEAVVKQSFSAMVGGFWGMLLSVIVGGITFLIPGEYGNITKVILCVLLVTGTLVLYQRNNRAEL